MTAAYLPFLASHLWQSTVVVAIVWLLCLAFQKNPARLRHRLWLAASLKFLVPFSVLVSIGNQAGRRPAPAIARRQVVALVSETGQHLAVPHPESASVALPETQTPLPAVLFTMWICGFFASVLWWCVRWRKLR